MTAVVRLAIPAATVLVLLTGCFDSGPTAAAAATQRAVAVTVAEAQNREVRRELYSIGRLVSRNTPQLAAEIDARVVEIRVDEGEQVEQGQELVHMDTTALELSRQEALAAILQLDASIENEERRVARYRDLKSRDVVSQERLDDAEAKLAVDRASRAAARARLAIVEDRLNKACLSSPVTGRVERRHVSVGDYVKVGTPLITVTDTMQLQAELPFPETVGARLQTGQTLYLESPVAPGLAVEASIDHIRPQVGEMNRALTVIAEVLNPGPWRPEATVEAIVVIERRPDAVVVPLASVIRRPAGDVVYVLDGTGGGQQVVREQPVEVGERQNGWIEIRAGLEAGITVVTDGAYYLTAGAAVIVTGQADDAASGPAP